MMSTARAFLPATALLCLAAGETRAETFSVSTNLPQTHWGVTQGIDPFMACVTERTGGGITFEFYHSGMIASTQEALNAVNAGLADIAYIVMVAETARMPLNGIPMLPGLSDSVIEMTAANRAALDAEGALASEYRANNIVPLLINMYPAYQLAGRTATFDTLASMRNAKISAGGGSLIVTLDALGASPVEMNAGDLYVSIQQGTLDGSMLGLASIESYKLFEVLKSVSTNGMFGSATGTWSIGTAKWDGLSPEQQTAMRDCGREVEITLARWVDNWTEELEAAFAGHGVKTFAYSESELAVLDTQLSSARQAYINRLDSRGLPASAALQEYVAALQDEATKLAKSQ